MNNLSNIISKIKEESLIGTKINLAICKPISPLMQIVKSFSSELANKYPGGRWITVNDGSSPLYGRHLFIVPHADGRATIVHAPSASGLLHKVMQPVETKPKIDHETKIAPKEETSIAKMQEEYKKREELVGQVKAKKQELIEQKKAKRQEMTEFLKEKLGINPEEKFNLAQTELDKQIKNKLDNNEITIEEARKEKQIGTLKNSQERTKEENVLLEDAKKLMTGNGHLVTNKELAEVIDTNKVDLLKFSMEIKQFQDEISKLERSIKQERVTESLVSTPITFEPITDKDVDKFVREEKAIIDNIGNHYNLVIKTRGGIDKDGNEIKVKGQNFIEKSIKKGGFELFNAMSSYFTNNTILDGDKYDILGSQNAAIILNNYLKEKLPDYANDIDKLRGYVSKKADEISKEAINVGDSYLKSASQIYQLGKEEDSMFADIAQAMGYALSRTNLAYQQYGLSEGALNQMAELLYQAQSNKDEKVKLSASSLSNLQDKINRLGLKDNDITIDKTGGKLVGIINESGLKKLIKEKPSLKNKTNLVGYPTATDIKQGKLNETDWLPSKMKQYIDGTKLEPTDYQQAAARLIAEQKRVYLNFDAGTGKCQRGNTPVILANGKITTLKEIWDDNSNNIINTNNEGMWAKCAIPILSLSDNKIIPMLSTQVYKQNISENIYVITTTSGRKLEVTGEHLLPTIKNGVVTWIKAKDWKVNDRIAIPNKLDCYGKHYDNDLIELIAWQISEGNEPTLTNGRRSACVSITQKDNYIRSRIKNLVEKNANSLRKGSHIQEKGIVINWTSIEWKEKLEKLGYNWGNISKNKAVPSEIMGMSDENVRVFLRTYTEAEGSVTGGYIELSTASEKIANQLSYLFLRVGIITRTKEVMKMATNGNNIKRRYFRIMISGENVHKYAKEIGFISERKSNLLNKVVNRDIKLNTNVNTYPISDLLLNHVEKVKSNPLEHIKNKHHDPSCLFIYGVHDAHRYVSGYKQLTKPKINQIIDYINDSEMKEKLINIVNMPIFWDKILLIEIEPEIEVYDLYVPITNNYISGFGGVITHNSLTYLLAINNIEDRTGKPCKTLIVMPDKIKDNFNDEVEKFSSYKADIAESSSKNKRGEIYKNSNMVIINKEKLAADYNLLQEAGFDMIIVDEAHTVTQNEENSNKKSQQSEFLTKLAKTIPYYIAGSGTPTPTNLSQLHYHLDNISPDQYGTANEFMKKYGSLHKEAGFKDFVNKVFNEKINDNVFTVKKTLDTKLHLNEDFIPLSKKQKQQLKEINQSFLNGEINGKVRYDESKRVINTTNIEDNPKFKHIKGILDKHFATSNPKEKVAFYFETYKDLGIFKEFLTKEYGKGSTVEFVGSGEESKKSDINKAKFKNDDNVKFSLHTPAGCTGLNLQYNGKEGGATRLIVASSGVNSWANVDQFFSRGNRKGAVKDVQAHIVNFNVPLDFQAQESRNSKKKIQGIIQEASKYDKNSLLT